MTKGAEPIWATGRRKTSVAQVRMVPGEGKLFVNSKTVEQHFGGHGRHQFEILAPLRLAPESKGYDFYIRVHGGGVTGQAEAVRHGLARALATLDEKIKKLMRREGFLTRDPRMVERKKPGQPKARKRFQYSKR
ncbi:MAG: 30S ribosomal protein S9 [Elusimicrobia bacterium]|nr:30S ribosomal protein S9 [Elusimicrobiota bacterium]